MSAIIYIPLQNGLLSNDAFTLKCPQSAGADFDAYLFSVNYKRLLLKIWFPNFLGVTL